MPKHDNLSDLNKSLTEQSEEPVEPEEPEEPDQNPESRKYTKRDACVPVGICGLLVGVGLLCGYLIHESYLIEDGSI